MYLIFTVNLPEVGVPEKLVGAEENITRHEGIGFIYLHIDFTAISMN